nr:class I SAM-dependent methyltransferase [Chryseosolibacter histidini]
MIAVNQCPVCEGKVFRPYLKCKDHTVSHETFQLIKCENCKLVITSPRPTNEALGRYYLSDDYVSHAKKSKGLFDKVYKTSRLYTLRWKLNLVKENLRSKGNSSTILDFGCGTGEFLQTCKQNGFVTTGVEPSDIARAHAAELTAGKVHSTLEEVEGSFQVITLWHVLEHVPDLNQKIEQLKSKLEKDGIMFIAVPNHQSYDARTYQERWAGYDVPRHLWHFSEPTMSQLLKKHGLTLEKIIPMKLDAFYVSMLSEKHSSGRSSIGGFIQGFVNGFRSNALAKPNEYSSLIYLVRK